MRHYSILIVTATSILLTFSVSGHAQTLADRVWEDRSVAAGVYHPYHYENAAETPAPKGYKPFYIEHYGRHGSRYHTSSHKFFDAGLAGLESADSAGLLTETGKQLFAEMLRIRDAHLGMEGQLTQRGAGEHRGIATRMYDHYSKVFNNRTRTEVSSISSIVPRCLVSMANFTNTLSMLNPELEMSYDTGNRYMEYIAKDIDSKALFKDSNRFEDSLSTAICHYDKLFASLFTNPSKAESLIGKPLDFVQSIYLVGTICEDLAPMEVDLFKYFSTEELIEQTTVRNDKMYGQFGNSREWGQVSSASAKWLVRDFVEKADAALAESSRRAADLRFGHDTGILPFFGLIRIEGFDKNYSMSKAHEHGWLLYDHIPMGTNFQMIFYKNRKGDVIVKLLKNEKEAVIPELKTWSGPYYKWDELRNYFVSLYE